jgi:hypothetical protein
MDKEKYDFLVSKTMGEIEKAVKNALGEENLTPSEQFTVTTGVSFFLTAEHISALLMSQPEQKDFLVQSSINKIMELVQGYLSEV